jgi:ribosome-binding factor A
MPTGRRQYPRVARINELLREIIAEYLEQLVDEDERLDLVTVTGVASEPDLRRATVFYSARHEGAGEALQEHRIKLQAAIGREARFKRTPQLAFVEDHGVTSGWRIEGILKELKEHDDEGNG